MKVIVTGAAGQLGRALLAAAPAGVEVLARARAELDVADADAVAALVRQTQPSAIINTAAYTNVDRAEDEPAEAARVNTQGARVLASACREHGARLVHVSTDFVFDGARGVPYAAGDAARPLGVYGLTKLDGEREVRAILGRRACVVRTSWLYGSGAANFVSRILQALRKGAPLRVVVDQVGAPTWTGSLAPALWQALARELEGVHHWCDSGVASRYDFAVAIAEEAAATGLLPAAPAIEAIAAAQYPLRAPRPAYSVLDKRATEAALGLRAEHWRVNLRRMLREPGSVS